MVETDPASEDFDDKRLHFVLEAWKQTVEVQQHFNDLELRIRNFAITSLGAVIGASAVTLDSGLSAAVLEKSVSAASIIMSAGLIIWLAFYLMDRHWYHRLLMGAVLHGQTIEQKYRHVLPELDLTAAISKESPSKFLCWRVHSKVKMDVFYGLGAAILLAGILVLSPIDSDVGDNELDADQEVVNAANP